MKFRPTVFAVGIVLTASLIAPSVSAAVTPYAWLRAGESGIMADSSGQNHPFNAAFSSGCEAGAGGGGQTAAVTSPVAAGGPLGTTGATSAVSTRWGSFNCGNSGMWIQGPNNSVPPASQWSLPAVNWVMEVWVLPEDDGASGNGKNAQIASTGSGQFGGPPGGAAFRTTAALDENGEEVIMVRADGIGAGAAQIGDAVPLSTTRWTHLAVVNDNGVTSFYVNGVKSGESSATVSAPSGVPYIGSGQDTGAPYKGYIDEVRYSTFAAGAFAVTDLLTLPPGPGFISQPASASVWNGGAAPFEVVATFDAANTYQWKRGDAIIIGATGPEFFLPTVNDTDNGSIFKVVVSKNGVDVTTPDAILTVVPNQTENNAFYRAAVQGEASLLAYFPVDGDTGATLSNVEAPALTAALQGGASYDGGFPVLMVSARSG